MVERILFIYAKLNPGTGYVQGMNELVGPLYYTLASDPNKEWRGMVIYALLAYALALTSVTTFAEMNISVEY